MAIVDKQQVNGDKHVTIADEPPVTAPIDDVHKSPPRNSREDLVQPVNNVDLDDLKLNSNDTTHSMVICPTDPQVNNVCLCIYAHILS